MDPSGDSEGTGRWSAPLWSRAFRPFFLGASLHAALTVLAWTAAWLGLLPMPRWLYPTAWHAHEMLFGLVAGGIAGFLLTAAPVWTGRPALRGAPLAALFGLWLAGRVALATAGLWPLWAVAVVDLAFLPAVGLAILRTLHGSGQRRNQAVAGLVFLLAGLNAALHAQALGLAGGAAGRALPLAVHLVVVLILVIGGRITPAFTRNALQRAGVEARVWTSAGLDALAVGTTLAFALASFVAPWSAWTGLLAVGAGVAAAARMAGWQTVRTGSDALLGSLHAGSLWVVAGLLLTGATRLGAPVPATSGLHALTAGAMGAMLLAVMTRVALGHTGRPLVATRAGVVCIALGNGGALLRVAAPFAGGELYRLLLAASGLAWAGAFGLYAVSHAGILMGPRGDGKRDGP